MATRSVEAKIPKSGIVGVGGVSDSNVFQRVAVATHAVSLKVRERDHGVIVKKVLADHKFFPV